MKILVTGGGGFLGLNLVRRLLKEGHEVRSFSRSRHSALDSLGVRQHHGYLENSDQVRCACSDVELVFHVAAKAGYWGRRDEYYRTNVLGTRNVLESCRNLGVGRLVFTSTPSLVFTGHDMEGANEDAPYSRRYKAFYPWSKSLAEQEVLSANGPDLATVALRPHLVWGPGDPHFLPRFLERARSGTLRRIGSLDKLVDFTYIDNVVEAHLLAAEPLEVGSRIAGKAYFITQEEPIGIWAFVDRVLDCAGLPPVKKAISPTLAYALGYLLEPVYRTLSLPGEPRMTRFLAESLSTAHWFDISAARRDFGYNPLVDMEEGFRRLRKSLENS